jgi:hypothetical protein
VAQAHFASPTSQYATALLKDSPAAWNERAPDSAHGISTVRSPLVGGAKGSGHDVGSARSVVALNEGPSTQSNCRPSSYAGSWTKVRSRRANRKLKKVGKPELPTQQPIPVEKVLKKKPTVTTARNSSQQLSSRRYQSSTTAENPSD